MEGTAWETDAVTRIIAVENDEEISYILLVFVGELGECVSFDSGVERFTSPGPSDVGSGREV